MLNDFRAYQLAKELHWGCKKLKLPRFLHDQLYRASASVALNVAEGSGKATKADQQRFYGFALGSLRECQAVLDLERVEDPQLLKLVDNLGAILFTLCRTPATHQKTAN